MSSDGIDVVVPRRQQPRRLLLGMLGIEHRDRPQTSGAGAGELGRHPQRLAAFRGGRVGRADGLMPAAGGS